MLLLLQQQSTLRIGVGDDESIDVQLRDLGTIANNLPSNVRVDIVREETEQ